MVLKLIVVLLIIAVSGKWLLLSFLTPSLMAFAKYKKGKHSFLCKLIAAPYAIVNKITRGGYLIYVPYFIGLSSSNAMRKIFCKISGASIAPKVIMHIGMQVREPWKLKIGMGTIVGDHCILDARSGLNIGSNVNISSNVSIWSLQHDYRDPYFACPTPDKRKLEINIEDRAWLGCNVIVLPGVTIGEGAVCCGGCVVTKDVEPYSVVAGIPAKKIGERPKNLKYNFDGKSCCLF